LVMFDNVYQTGKSHITESIRSFYE